MADLNKEFIVNLQGKDIPPLKDVNPNHNKYKHGLKDHPIYNVWKTMRQRCNNPNDADYKQYGGRGISITKRWNDPVVFFNWAVASGYKKGLTLDRIDNNKGYSASNCRWVDMKVQNSNRRDNNKLTFKGRTETLSEWSRITGINRTTLFKRKEKGWKPEKILSKIDWRSNHDEN